jgi:hypothetical protein
MNDEENETSILELYHKSFITTSFAASSFITINPAASSFIQLQVSQLQAS